MLWYCCIFSRFWRLTRKKKKKKEEKGGLRGNLGKAMLMRRSL